MRFYGKDAKQLNIGVYFDVPSFFCHKRTFARHTGTGDGGFYTLLRHVLQSVPKSTNRENKKRFEHVNKGREVRQVQ